MTSQAFKNVQRLNAEPVSIAEFGAISGGVIDNWSALVAAAAAGVSHVQFPPGIWYFEPPAGQFITVSADLIITGAGIGATIINIGPNANNRSYTAFKPSNGVSLTFRDMTIRGPATPAINVDTAYFSRLVNFPATSGSLLFHNCQIDGEFFEIVNSDSGSNGTGIISFEDCPYVHAQHQIVAIFANNKGKTFRARNTTFVDTGLPESIAPFVSGHTLYIHPTVNVILENCTFDTFKRLALHHYGTTLLPIECAETIAKIDACVFKNSGSLSTATIETKTFGPASEINNCSFNNVRLPVVYRGSTNITNCTFENSLAPYVQCSLSGCIDNATINIRGCRFQSWTGGLNVVFANVVTNTIGGVAFDGNNLKVNIDSSSFLLTASSPPASQKAYVLRGQASNKISVSATNCTARISTAQTAQGFGLECLSAQISNCMFDGQFETAAIATAGSVITNCSVSSVAFKNSGTGPDIALFHSSSAFVTGQNFDFSGLVTAAAASSAAFSLNQKQSAGTIASAGNLVLPVNSAQHQITGTTTIDNIYLGSSSTPANKAFEGSTITLITQGAFSTSNSGNIVPLTTGARSVGVPIRLIYNVSDAKWYEI